LLGIQTTQTAQTAQANPRPNKDQHLKAKKMTIQPTNRVAYEEKSFTVPGLQPVGLKTQTDVYSCE
jgi:hypothetical protein